MTDDELTLRRREVHARFEAAVEQVINDIREIDLADPDADDYPAGVLTAWALVWEQRTYDDDGDGLTGHNAIAREDQSILMSAALGRWLMLDREAVMHAAE